MKMPWFAALAFFAVISGQQPGTIAIQSQKWLDTPVRHLEIQGLLNGDTAFQIWLPPAPSWKGRILQFLPGGFGGMINRGNNAFGQYALANGAAFVESSQGHTGLSIYEENNTPTEIAYEASYTVMQYAKARCVEIYGKEPRFSYLFGGSGGGVRATGLLERFPKVYDGAVPYVGAGTNKFQWYQASLFDYYQPVLQSKAAALLGAVGPSGTGDPFSVLETPAENEALRMVLTGGLPRLALDTLRDPYPAGIRFMSATKYKYDPAYFDDFWKLDRTPDVATRVVAGIPGVVASTDNRRTLTIDSAKAPANLRGFTIAFTSGKLAGEWRHIVSNEGSKLLVIEIGPGVPGLQAGDRFELDNRDLLAWMDYHRHIADPNEPAAREFYRDGKAIYRQRPDEAMRFLDETDRVQGKIRGKMIAIFGAVDPLVWPVTGARYDRGVQKQVSGASDHFRIHFVENSPHGGSIPPSSRYVSKMTVVYKALDDVMAWVETGKAPVEGTQYKLDALNQLVLPPAAALRKGYQPVVRIAANGRRERLEVQAGSEVVFEVQAEDPDNELVKAEMDFEGDDHYDQRVDLHGRAASARFSFRYDKPGAYRPAVRVTDSTVSPGSREKGIQNLAAIRIVVKP
jgi:hypothetical protein